MWGTVENGLSTVVPAVGIWVAVNKPVSAVAEAYMWYGDDSLHRKPSGEPDRAEQTTPVKTVKVQ